MKKFISKNEAKVFIRNASLPNMDPAAKERIKQVVLSAYADVTKVPEQRYIKQRGLFNYLFSHPMAPIIIAIIMILSGTSTVLASDGAKPGDLLYPLDKALEQTRLNFTLGDQAKAKYMVKIVEERQRERLQLEVEQKNELLIESDKDTNQALEHAEEALNEVRVRQEEQENERAKEAVEEIDEKLNELQERHQEQIQERIESENREGVEEDVDEDVVDDNDDEEEVIDDDSQDRDRDRNMNQNRNQNTNQNYNEEDESEDDSDSNVNSSEDEDDENDEQQNGEQGENDQDGDDD